MKYVLDSNVAVKWYLPEADSAKARQVASHSI
jgi:predicted nucleic acid-binding protein